MKRVKRRRIANCLNRNSDDGIGWTGTGQSKKVRYILMNNRIKIQNAVEMCDRLKMVRAFFNFLSTF